MKKLKKMLKKRVQEKKPKKKLKKTVKNKDGEKSKKKVQEQIARQKFITNIIKVYNNIQGKNFQRFQEVCSADVQKINLKSPSVQKKELKNYKSKKN